MSSLCFDACITTTPVPYISRSANVQMRIGYLCRVYSPVEVVGTRANMFCLRKRLPLHADGVASNPQDSQSTLRLAPMVIHCQRTLCDRSGPEARL